MKKSVFTCILDFMFPTKCIFCRTVLPISKEVECCEKCYEEIEFYPDQFINVYNNAVISSGISALKYLGIVEKAIHRFKYNNKMGYSRVFSYFLIEKIRKMRIKDIDFITYVPLSKKRKGERGYNQSKVIAKHIAKALNVEIMNCLVKVQDNNSQSSLNRNERLLNVKGIYKIRKNIDTKNKNILIIDDIMTTGATLNECAKILQENDSGKIYSAVIASSRKI